MANMIQARLLVLCLALVVGCSSTVFSSEEQDAGTNACAGLSDVELTLYVDGDQTKPWTAYCKDGATYLSLVAIGNGANFSQYTAGSTSAGTNVVTEYSKVRVNNDLMIDISDQTFATSSGQLDHAGTTVTSMPFAVAMTCTSDAGWSNVDLRGTPFRLVSSFCRDGTGIYNVSDGDQVANLQAQGWCGWIAPIDVDGGCLYNPYNEAGGFILQLGYID